MPALKCIAHRGGPLANNQPLPENSLAAISRALDLGVDAIEIDIYQIEGELLVTHDRRLGRLTKGEGIITEKSLAYLRELRLENGESIPTLRDVLTLVGGSALLNIEIKGAGCVPALQTTLAAFCAEQQGSYEQYVVSSFDHQQLYSCLQCMPQVRRGALIEGIPLGYAKCCDALQAYSFNMSLSFLSEALLTDASKRGLKKWVYTANHEEDWCWLEKCGVDAVFTDKPDALLARNSRFNTLVG
jgi:glycerophosphoryl diester phosphodiesterase